LPEDKSPETIREYYQRQGEAGDHQRKMYGQSEIWANWWQNRRRTIVEQLIREHHVQSLLDVGCAEGSFVRFLAEGRESSVGVDISEPKLIRARDYSHNLNSVSFVLADASDLPFNASSFDMVICIDVLRYLPDLTKAVKELFRVSKKYVVLQSATEPRRMLSSRLVKRPREIVERELQSSLSAGSFWYIPSKALVNMTEYDDRYKCSKVIGHFSVLVAVPYRLLHVKGHGVLERGFVKLAKNLDNILTEIPLLNRMGFFTTVLFEKYG
jgi:2-polyprenyl-3-methyl-5-hydroxy-6-metoxy-1,4-benzoquinol methylase